jgi:hypothetical protein
MLKKNVNNKLTELSRHQDIINSRLDEFENRNDYSFQRNFTTDKDKLNKDLDELMASMKHGVNLNYANFYEDALVHSKKKSRPKAKPPVQRKVEESVNLSPEKRARYVINEEAAKRKQKSKEKLNLFNLNKSEFHKRQNLYLTNEMVSLRVKLNKTKNKNQLLKSLVNGASAIKNCHIMEKLITNFIEALAVNWNEVVELLIDDLITEEVYNLNEIELARSKYNEVNVEEFSKEIKRIENDSEIFDPHKFELDMYEMNKIIDEFNKQEKDYRDKYNNN